MINLIMIMFCSFFAGVATSNGDFSAFLACAVGACINIFAANWKMRD